MTQTERIKALLKSWNDVVFIPNTSTNNSEKLYNGGNISIEFFVAPKNGLYTEKELQNFLYDLAHRISCQDIRSFHDKGLYLEIGSLYFSERIGMENVRRKTSVFDRKLTLGEGFVRGKKVTLEQRTLKRTIQIWLYPDEAIMREVTRNGETYIPRISKDYNGFREAEKNQGACQEEEG